MSTTAGTQTVRIVPGQTYTSAGEPVETPPGAAEPSGPRHPRLRKTLRIIRTTVVVLVLLAAAVAGGSYIVRERVAAGAFVDAGTAVLTAPPIPVGSADAGVVKEITVADRESVTAGAELARVTLTADGVSDEPKVQTLRAPVAGIVTVVNVAVGEVARAGEPVVTLYDPTKLQFQVEVPLDALRKMRLGMSASISGPGLNGEVAAKLEKVVPKVDAGDPAAVSDRLTVTFKPDPASLATVQTLVPGLQFAVVVDTNTAVGSTPAVNSA